LTKRLSQPIGLHATPRPDARLFDLASDEPATLRDVLPLDLPHGMGDRIQLQQALLNSLLNAAEAMREVSPVRRRMVVRAIADHRAAGPWALVSIENAGFGEAEAARRFEAFYTTKPGGLGIGRSIRRSIIDSHRDWLWATANPDHGATFHVA